MNEAAQLQLLAKGLLLAEEWTRAHEGVGLTYWVMYAPDDQQIIEDALAEARAILGKP